MNIYEEMVAAGAQIDHHESDLYVKATPKTMEIVRRWSKVKGQARITTFRSNADGDVWYDIPFMYIPWWNARESPKEAELI